jgi:hypothetical protein
MRAAATTAAGSGAPATAEPLAMGPDRDPGVKHSQALAGNIGDPGRGVDPGSTRLARLATAQRRVAKCRLSGEVRRR